MNPSIDLDRAAVSYIFDLYADSALQNMLAQQTTSATQWMVPAVPLDNTWYYWRVQAQDTNGEQSGWGPVCSFYVNSNGINNPPDLVFSAPSQKVYTNAPSFLIQVQENDPDNNADVALYYDRTGSGGNGTLIYDGLKQDPNGSSESYLWNISGLPEGTYYPYAIITNATVTKTVYAPGSVIVDRTPPVVTASPSGGQYTGSQSVTLSANEPSTIYFTLDGTTPSKISPVYTAPISLTGTTTLNFMGVDLAGNQSTVVSYTYNITSPGSPVDGTCGSANGQCFTAAPSSNLCGAGTASTVSGSGPWNWTCAGLNGGATVSCSANPGVNGVCGSANGQSFTAAPSSNLCGAGTASTVSGSGPWSWTCAGSNGGSTANCSASSIINGACGSANGQSFFSAPTSNLCSAGTATALTGTGPWGWSCAGSSGGSTASCSANPEVNGACGSSNGQGFTTAPSSNLCSAGAASTSYRERSMELELRRVKRRI